MHGQLRKNWEKNTGSCLILAKTVQLDIVKIDVTESGTSRIWCEGLAQLWANVSDCW